MKQFLYLDTDIVNSIIAQSEKGLIQEQSEENGSDKKKGTHISGSMEGSRTAGGSFIKLAKAEANLSLSGELGKEYVSSTTSREIISKSYRADVVFEQTSSYSTESKILLPIDCIFTRLVHTSDDSGYNVRKIGRAHV